MNVASPFHRAAWIAFICLLSYGVTSPVFAMTEFKHPALDAYNRQKYPVPKTEDRGPYYKICHLCHDKGASLPGSAGAPRLGDKKAWETRRKSGVIVLTEKIINPPPGVVSMPFADLSRDEVRAAVQFMLDESEPY